MGDIPSMVVPDLQTFPIYGPMNSESSQASDSVNKNISITWVFTHVSDFFLFSNTKCGGISSTCLLLVCRLLLFSGFPYIVMIDAPVFNQAAKYPILLLTFIQGYIFKILFLKKDFFSTLG